MTIIPRSFRFAARLQTVRAGAGAGGAAVSAGTAVLAGGGAGVAGARLAPMAVHGAAAQVVRRRRLLATEGSPFGLLGAGLRGMEPAPGSCRRDRRRPDYPARDGPERRLPQSVFKNPALAAVCHFEGGATRHRRLALNPARRLRNLPSAAGGSSHRHGTGPVRPYRSRQRSAGCRVCPPANPKVDSSALQPLV
jgi:hypothetical protein